MCHPMSIPTCLLLGTSWEATQQDHFRAYGRSALTAVRQQPCHWLLCLQPEAVGQARRVRPTALPATTAAWLTDSCCPASRRQQRLLPASKGVIFRCNGHPKRCLQLVIVHVLDAGLYLGVVRPGSGLGCSSSQGNR